jgi:ABC-type glycerol-3-phosphate transport system substrate-binding protein
VSTSVRSTAAGLGLKDSRTTDEFTEYAKALTQAGQQWGVALDVAGIGDPVQNLLLAVYAYGGKWVKGDTNSSDPEPLIFNSSETVQGITWYANLYKAGYAVPIAPTDSMSWSCDRLRSRVRAGAAPSGADSRVGSGSDPRIG